MVCEARLPDGRQVQRKIGPAWTGCGRPAAGYVTKRLAEDWLRGVLDEARRGTLPGCAPAARPSSSDAPRAVRTGATVADAAAEYLRYIEHDPGAQAVDASGLSVGDRGTFAAGVRIDAG